MKSKTWLSFLTAPARVTVIAMLWAGAGGGAQLPLASVKYFNPYQNPTNWGGWGSALYWGNGATARNVGGTVPVDQVDGAPAMVLDTVNPPGAYWNVQFKVSGNPLNFLRIGTNPAIHLRLKWSSIPTNGSWNMNVSVEGAVRGLTNYVTPSTSAWQDVFIPAADLKAVRPSVALSRVWLIAMQATGNYSDHCVLNISALDVVPSPGQLTYTEFAKVNQVGYTPLMSKLGVVSWEPGTISTPPTTFQVVDSASSGVVFTGSLTKFVAPAVWQAPGWTLDGDTNYLANFGTLRTPGTYRLELPELGVRSPDFVVDTNAYSGLLRDALRFFYYSRSGGPIAAPYAEGFTRTTLYTNNTRAGYNYSPAYGHYNFGSNTNRDVHGCWFDAGDTHVDVPNTAIACWFLLETLRDFGPCLPPGSLNLPESGSQQGDLVPLISWGLDWLKRMQNADGSMHHYVRDEGTGVEQVSDISSFAASCAAGTFAKAYAVMGSQLSAPDRADLLSRAQLSWTWLQAHANVMQPRLPLQNGADPGSDDTSWGDATFDRRCRAYAAVELFEATGTAAYNTAFVTQFTQNGKSALSGSTFGANTTGYGSDNVLSYLNHPLNFAFMDYARSTRAVDASTKATLRSAILHQADVLTNYTSLSGYRVPMLYPSHLYWGACGGVLAPSGMVLARAFEWTGNTNYHEAALHALHFICGRNPVNRVMVSGYGDYSHSADFYSQFWTDLQHQPPGYLGGNINVTGSATPVVANPWKRFINTQDADMTEPGVYWNSAFAWLVGYAVNDATPPQLVAAKNGNGLNLTWHVRSAAYALYSTTNLGPTASWSSPTNKPALSNGVATVQFSSRPVPGSFYRLAAP